MAFLVDTGFAYAITDIADQHYRVARNLYLNTKESMLLPAPTLTELAYLFRRNLGASRVAQGFRVIRSSCLEIADLLPDDYDRVFDILDQYSDSRIDFVDACIMAMAERLKITSVLTFDRRDFGLYRPTHVDHFELFP